MKSTDPINFSVRHFSVRHFLLVVFTCFTFAGCSWFGGEDDDPLELGDVCSGKSNEFVTQFPNGLGVTSDDCGRSENGEWIEGRCYCHGIDG